MDLHYSQTLTVCSTQALAFESPMDLHYSQTVRRVLYRHKQFESPMDLHYSQTIVCKNASPVGLNPLWIYTTLKLNLWRYLCLFGLNPLWIYTTLKRAGMQSTALAV